MLGVKINMFVAHFCYRTVLYCYIAHFTPKKDTTGEHPPPTTKNKQTLKETVLKASQNLNICQRQWVSGLMQLFQARNIELNIKS